jgi:acyl-coenzyme A thioesterase PaaI-like protein
MSTTHYRTLERLFLSAPINKFYSPSIEISDGRAIIEFAVRDDFFHAADSIHGSIYFKALDDAAFFAVNSVVPEVFLLTVSFNIYINKPVSGGVLRAEGRLVSTSSRHFVGESILFADGVEVARGSGTFLKSMIELSRLPGIP